MDFERRLAVERDIEKTWDYKNREGLTSVSPSVGFDETDNVIYFGCMVGIKFVNYKTGQIVKIVGKVENTERFLQMRLYQGRP